MIKASIRYSAFIVLFAFFGANSSRAQEAREWEVYGGYSLLRSDVRQYFRPTPVVFTFRGQYANLNGWEGSVTENLNDWFGGTLDVSGHYKTPVLQGTPNRQRIHSVLFGPRFSYRRVAGFTPFGHMLAGVTHADVRVTPVGPSDSDLSFAIAGGGGLDWNLWNSAAIRVFQAEYFRTSVLGVRPNGLRASAGIVFYLGERK